MATDGHARIRVLHLCATDGASGAEKAAFRIHQGLRRIGVDSHMLVEYKLSRDPTVHPACGIPGLAGRALYALRSKVDLSPLRRYLRRRNDGWTAGWLPRGLPRMVRSFGADVVHLHWLSAFGPIQELPRIGSPSVWTLQDASAVTGGCCYTNGCTRFREGCGMCPILQSERDDDLSAWTLRRKVNHWRDWPVRILGISPWLTDMAAASSALGDKSCSTSVNAVNLEVFAPSPMRESRSALGLPLGVPLLLFGAISLSSERKGGAYLVAALNLLSESWPNDRERPELVVFGTRPEDLINKVSFRVHSVGYVTDETRLAQVYAAADCMVVPSLEDGNPQTVIESLACGTPVVAFRNTGPEFLVGHRRTGYLASDRSAADLAAGIAWGLHHPDKQALRSAARAEAQHRFCQEAAARRHVAIYRETIQAARIPHMGFPVEFGVLGAPWLVRPADKEPRGQHRIRN